MSRPRGQSESSKSPHSISIKVLRLSRPSLSPQCPLPKQSSDAGNRLDRRAALSCSLSNEDDDFYWSPVLNLPASFGTVYVGETLCATVCANNELPLGLTGAPSVSNVRLTADITTPSRGEAMSLELESGKDGAIEEGVSVGPGETLQRILRFAMREEGNHVLAVTVTYMETQSGEGAHGAATSARVRTFRKLYQFTAQQLLGVRTKTRRLAFGRGGHVLEAQLENLGDHAIHIESVAVQPKPAFTSRGLNAWDRAVVGGEEGDAQGTKPSLQPGSILQVAYLVEAKQVDGGEPAGLGSSKDGRETLGQMWIQWRGSMGEQGSLNTGWLMGRRA